MAPSAIDQEALDSPNLKVLDIHHPPMKAIPFQEFPRMVYLHPVDKTREHRTRIVADKKELDAALKQGFRKDPHVPEAAEPEIDPEEYETA